MNRSIKVNNVNKSLGSSNYPEKVTWEINKVTTRGKVSLDSVIIKKENTDSFDTDDVLIHKNIGGSNEICIDDIKPDVGFATYSTNQVVELGQEIEREDFFTDFSNGDDAGDDNSECGIDPLEGIGESPEDTNDSTIQIPLTSKDCSEKLISTVPAVAVTTSILLNSVLKTNTPKTAVDDSQLESSSRRKQKFTSRVNSSSKSDSGSEVVSKDVGKRHYTYQCSQCDMSYSRPSHLIQHTRVHTGERPYKCTACPKEFRLQHHLRDHARVHTGARPFKCSFCSNSYSTLSIKKDHEKTHTGERPFKCSFCSNSYTTFINKRDHEKTHTGEFPYICTICKKSFKCRKYLKLHEKIHPERIVKIHTGSMCERTSNGIEHVKLEMPLPYNKCSVCNKVFQESSLLKVHEKIHLGETPYKCSFCSKEFRGLDSLRLHMKNHTGEKPFKCSVCLLSFSSVNHLKQHERLHLEARKSLIKGPIISS